MTTTLKQAAANRRNAKRSTGPNTEEGRERAKMNARKHGLPAKTIIIAAERADDYEAFRDTMFGDLSPVGALECILTERIVFCAWRLRRAARKEASIDRRARAHAMREYAELKESYIRIGSERARDPPEDDDDRPTSDQMNLLRYETAIERGFYRALHNLERVQARAWGTM